MSEKLLLLPGILSDAEFWRHQTAALAGHCDPVSVDVTRHDSIAGIARHALASAPERFALAGLSLGGYVAFEIMRQAPQRVTRLALLDTHARIDPPEATPRREKMLELATSGRFSEIMPGMLPTLLH